MIIDDDNFKDLIKRLAERRASWGDFDRLARFAEVLLEENKQQADALGAMLGRKSSTVIDGMYIYKAASGGAAVMSRKLNYEANKREWQPGDIVIHDADEKSPRMLMIVLGYSRDGQVRSRYLIGKAKGRNRRVWKNYMDCLHEPERFGLQSHWGKYDQERLHVVQEQWNRVRVFNHNHTVGECFSVSCSDGSRYEAKTISEAYLDNEGYAVVALSDSTATLLGSLKPASEKVTA